MHNQAAILTGTSAKIAKRRRAAKKGDRSLSAKLHKRSGDRKGTCTGLHPFLSSPPVAAHRIIRNRLGRDEMILLFQTTAPSRSRLVDVAPIRECKREVAEISTRSRGQDTTEPAAREVR